MSGTTHWGPVSIWHHRVLGTIWALCGLVTTGSVLAATFQHGSPGEYQFWIALLGALAYVVTGIGFILARTWARRTMTKAALSRIGWTEQDLRGRGKGHPSKVELALESRDKTTMPMAWIAERLCMGTRGHLAWLLQQRNVTGHKHDSLQPQLGL